MSTTIFSKPLQFKNVNVSPQTPNLQQIKQLRMKSKNKLKDMIPPTNPPTPKLKKNDLLKKILSKNKQNVSPQTLECKNLSKNLSFNYLAMQNKKSFPHTYNNVEYQIMKQKNLMKNSVQAEGLELSTIKTTRAINSYCRHKPIHYYECHKCIQQTFPQQQQTFQQEQTFQQSQNHFLHVRQNSQFYAHKPRRESSKQTKIQGLNQFKSRVDCFQAHLDQVQSSLRERFQQHQFSFHQNTNYIANSIQAIIKDLITKEKNMTNQLFQGQQNIQKIYKQNLTLVKNIKKSLQRYINDIDRHYDDIVDQLQMNQFVNIIHQYDGKLKYFNKNIQDMTMPTQLSVFIPLRDLQNVINKAKVQLYEAHIYIDQIKFKQDQSKSDKLKAIHIRNRSLQQNETTNASIQEHQDHERNGNKHQHY